MSGKCSLFHALKWQGETPGTNCNSDKVQLEPLQPSAEPIRSLLTGDHLRMDTLLIAAERTMVVFR